MYNVSSQIITALSIVNMPYVNIQTNIHTKQLDIISDVVTFSFIIVTSCQITFEQAQIVSELAKLSTFQI